MPWLTKILLIWLIFIIFEFKKLKIVKALAYQNFFLLLMYSLVYDLPFDMRLKKILFFAASIIKFFIIFFFSFNCISDDSVSKYYIEDKGTVSLMYHRFNENKYPSTNIQMDIFEDHINLIKSENLEFENIKDFNLNFYKKRIKENFNYY